jgi:hypothetical protein
MKLKAGLKHFAEQLQDGLDAGHRIESIQVDPADDGSLVVIGLENNSPIAFATVETQVDPETMQKQFELMVSTLQAIRDFVKGSSPPPPAGA